MPLKKILTVLLLTGLAVGCAERQSAENARVRQAHQEVNALLGQASLAYVPGEQVDVRWAAWRQDQQAKALETLQSVLKEGSVSQQVATRRLLADIHDSAARYQLASAIDQWADLSRESALLLSYLMVVDRADAQVRNFSIDQSSLIASLRKQTADIEKESQAHQKELEQWQAKARDLTAQFEAAHKQALSLGEQASTLRGQAFSLTGDERLASYEKAAQIAIQGNKASAEAQKLESQLGIARSQVALAERKLKLANDAIADGKKYIQNAIDNQTQQTTLRDKAQQDKQQAIDKLDSELAELVKNYQQVRETQFQSALARLDQAIELLEGALPLTNDSKIRREIQLDILARKVSRLHLLSIEATAAGDWAAKLAVVHQGASDAKRPGGAMIADKAAFYDTTTQSAVQARDEIVANALTTANEATELATQLASQGGEGDSIATQARSLGTLVTDYARQVNAVKG